MFATILIQMKENLVRFLSRLEKANPAHKGHDSKLLTLDPTIKTIWTQ